MDRLYVELQLTITREIWSKQWSSTQALIAIEIMNISLQ